jgi:hypothetical protein
MWAAVKKMIAGFWFSLCTMRVFMRPLAGKLDLSGLDHSVYFNNEFYRKENAKGNIEA